MHLLSVKWELARRISSFETENPNQHGKQPWFLGWVSHFSWKKPFLSLSLLEICLGICCTPVLGNGTKEKTKELAGTRVVQHKARRNDLLVIALQLAGIQEPLHQVRSRPSSWVALHGLRMFADPSTPSSACPANGSAHRCRQHTRVSAEPGLTAGI